MFTSGALSFHFADAIFREDASSLQKSAKVREALCWTVHSTLGGSLQVLHGIKSLALLRGDYTGRDAPPGRAEPH